MIILKGIYNSRVTKPSYAYDVTNQVTNSKTLFFLIFRVSNSMSKNLNIVLELVTRDF